MPNQFLRPYSAKAIVQHEFVTDHLNIYVTFRFAMDQTVKPANNLWFCIVDSISEDVTASAWQDAWTMLLTVDNIASIPERVTLEYDGPDPNLRITWQKQWEPWGPIVSEDSSLLPYGSFKGNGFLWQQAAAQNTWYQISDVAITVGTVHKMTFQNNQELKIAVAGFYFMSYSLCLECSIGAKHTMTAILIDGVPLPVGMQHHQFGHANEEYPISAPSLANLIVNRLVGVGVMTPDVGNPTLTVKNVTLVIHEIGTT